MIGLEKVSVLMQQEVSRKEFLRYVGIALLGVIGVTSMLQNLNKSLGEHATPTQKPSTGYGVSAYGR